MNSVHQLIQRHRIQPADAIVLRKKFFGMLDHYVIYIGPDATGQHRFIANYRSGVNFVQDHEILQYMSYLIPDRIERFLGDEWSRQDALKRAFSSLGKAYDLVGYNCEHFKNYVQHGVSKSLQVQTAGEGFMVGGLAAIAGGALGKNKGLLALGVVIGILGIIMTAIESSED